MFEGLKQGIREGVKAAVSCMTAIGVLAGVTAVIDGFKKFCEFQKKQKESTIEKTNVESKNEGEAS